MQLFGPGTWVNERLGFPQISAARAVQFPIEKFIRNMVIFVELEV
jgi:hypothetical protein